MVSNLRQLPHNMLNKPISFKLNGDLNADLVVARWKDKRVVATVDL